MVHGHLGTNVLVPVANPASVTPLVTIARQIAAPDRGAVHLVTVLRPEAPADEHAYAWQGLADAETRHGDRDVQVRGRVVHDSDPVSGVVQSMRDTSASLVIMGWRGTSSTTDIFGHLIDRIVGHSTAPLAIVRHGTVTPRRLLIPVSDDHLLPGGQAGVDLAAALALRLSGDFDEPATVLKTGAQDPQLPESVMSLSDRVHHDGRRTHAAVGAFARADDMIVAPVAPTVSGLRAATTHLAWAAPDATLVVAIDVGLRQEAGLDEAVQDAGQPAPPKPVEPERQIRIAVTVRLPEDGQVTTEMLERVLRSVGSTDRVMAWWPAHDSRAHVRATVTVEAAGSNAAIARVMTTIHDADELRGTEISYDVDDK